MPMSVKIFHSNQANRDFYDIEIPETEFKQRVVYFPIVSLPKTMKDALDSVPPSDFSATFDGKFQDFNLDVIHGNTGKRVILHVNHFSWLDEGVSAHATPSGKVAELLVSSNPAYLPPKDKAKALFPDHQLNVGTVFLRSKSSPIGWKLAVCTMPFGKIPCDFFPRELKCTG